MCNAFKLCTVFNIERNAVVRKGSGGSIIHIGMIPRAPLPCHWAIRSALPRKTAAQIEVTPFPRICESYSIMIRTEYLKIDMKLIVRVSPVRFEHVVVKQLASVQPPVVDGLVRCIARWASPLYNAVRALAQ